MILQSLRLRNFRRFESLFLELPENVIGIIGRNGAGKSTLLEAIAWALYGSRAARTEKSLLRRQTASLAEPCEVELTFSLAGTDYRVVRSLRGAQQAVEAALYRAGMSEAVAVRENDVSREIERILGLDRKSFEASIFAKQKELAVLSNLRDEERRKLISRLLNLDAIDFARKRALQEANDKRNFVEGSRLSQEDLAALQQQLCEQQALRAQAEEHWHTLEQQERDWRQKREQAKAAFEAESLRRDRAVKLQNERHTLQREMALLQQQVQQMENERHEIMQAQQKLAELAPVREHWQRLQAEKETLEENRRRLATLHGKQQLVKNLTEQRQKLEHEIAGLQQELEALPRVLAAENNVRESVRQAEAAVRAQREAEQRLLAELAKIKGKGIEEKQKLQQVQTLGSDSPCPVCTRPLGEHFEPVVTRCQRTLARLREEYLKCEREKREVAAQVQEAELRLQALQQERERLGNERVRLAQVQTQLAGQLQRAGELQQQSEQAQQEIRQLGTPRVDETRAAALQAELSAAEKQVAEVTRLEAHVARLPALLARLSQAAARLAACRQQEEAARRSLEELQFHEDVYRHCKQAYDEASLKHSQAQKQAGEAHAAFARAAAQVENLEQRIALMKERLAVIAQVKQEVQLLEALQEHLKAFRVAMAGRLRPLIESRASEIMRMATNGRYSLLELDESYNLYLYDQNRRFELNRFSGGEQDLLNLCLRVAISQVIAQRSGRPALQFIVLDEIFGSQDEERKLLLLATLQHLSSYFRQIFLITHEQGIKENLPVVLEVEMEGETSVVRMK
ncbi:MAG: SMC family ATPase [candidate division KSB1 bacterium]|nr:SMC family ATPase [candidate division KSB1 bacterium]MDZ7272810.1 SMC family ATPase [candidate division KSB1 bacterium]MDZ7284166.1 SMC family ATPase [candidate division KSB1 bacterium]MDZ7297436.1 SMC family ATPase [candidate division KSB1 bacterium]MDZ7308184.1 SMC family ATPase [candidate division KSB1 bacterium]